MKGFLRHILLLVNVALALAVVLGCLAPYVNPNIWIVPSFFVMLLPLFYLLNIILAIYWLSRWRREVFVSLVALLIGLPFMGVVFAVNEKQPAGKVPADFSLMTYNVRIFDRYEWTKDKATPMHITEYLRDNGADILCMQEFGYDDRNPHNSRSRIYSEFKKYGDKHIVYTKNNSKRHKVGVAIFSKYPIVDKGHIPFSGSHNFAIWADVKIGDKIVRIVSTHFQSLMLTKRGISFFSYLKNEPNQDALIDDVEHISSKLGWAFKERSRQAEKVAKMVADSPYPTVVCGDFNDIPNSYAYSLVKGEMNDLFAEKGRGFGRTYNGEYPAFRIDFVLYDRQLEAVSYDRPLLPYSDHLPVVGEFKFSQPDKSL